jgi:ParB family transcriptional regulator, chromosome partitioning protein
MGESNFYTDSIFWVEADRIQPNPYQPRREFDEVKLQDLAGSIRQYGILQPLVVTRLESEKEEGGMAVTYELIAGERRLRAAKLAGLHQVPVLIRTGEEQNRMKLELAIIENVQREDLNPIDRARAFDRLVKEFGFKHTQIGEKIGKSREYVANTVRLLGLPEEMQVALAQGRITEGHTRPLLMLTDRPEEQLTLYKEILTRKLTVREAEGISRRIAHERARRKDFVLAPQVIQFERELTEALGTRVQIETREMGGKILIEYFSHEDLYGLIELLKHKQGSTGSLAALSQMLSGGQGKEETEAVATAEAPLDDRSKEEKQQEEDDSALYSVKNFSI